MRGYTLLELLVTMAIGASMMALVLPLAQQTVERQGVARDVARLQQLLVVRAQYAWLHGQPEQWLLEGNIVTGGPRQGDLRSHDFPYLDLPRQDVAMDDSGRIYPDVLHWRPRSAGAAAPWRRMALQNGHDLAWSAP